MELAIRYFIKYVYVAIEVKIDLSGWVVHFWFLHFWY